MNKTIATLLAAIFLTACTPIQQACTDLSLPSVSVEVVDGAGADVLTAVVQFDVGSGPEDCDLSDGVHSCGRDIEGEFDILVSAPDFEDQVVSVTVESDVCHVITQDVRIEMVEMSS